MIYLPAFSLCHIGSDNHYLSNQDEGVAIYARHVCDEHFKPFVLLTRIPPAYPSCPLPGITAMPLSSG